jgi:hypothetical protein
MPTAPDVLRQTHAIQRALESVEALLLRGHLRTCVPTGIREGREEAVLAELGELYGVSRRWRPGPPEPGASAEDLTGEHRADRDHCARTIAETLDPLPGVRRVDVDIPGKRVRLEYD